MSRGNQAVFASSHDWMMPIEPDAPCGADLEYDPEFVVLSAHVAARMDAQYGDFVGVPEPVNWGDVERDCRRLMMRSKDVRLAVIFTRCRTRLAGQVGTAEGLSLLAAWLTTFASAIHPRPDVDEDPEAAGQIRVNALLALTDVDGLLADVRDIALTRSSVAHLRVRDVERAFAQPRPSDALAPESVIRQIEDLRAQNPDALMGFDSALANLQVIDAWGREYLGAHFPDLAPLARLLGHIANAGTRLGGADIEAADMPASTAAETFLSPVAQDVEEVVESVMIARTRVVDGEMGAVRTALCDRSAALDRIREARVWFEQHEPSSPIPLLLRRAERLAGKRYIEVIRAIPVELIEQWERE
ncbi:ImpA family type VI secretion system protein [Paraburkholderia edwinii]|jgi:type VI secretion system protein ImpA|nr:type VI secretion system ImpA family N-terminal domain-containing protein [Paraburkholderia edwinii]